MPLQIILFRLIKARLDKNDYLAEYFADHLAHMISNLAETASEEEWREHEGRCKKCVSYVLQFEMQKELVVTRELKEDE